MHRWLLCLALFFGVTAHLPAETVASLPQPTGYISDFAGVLSPDVKQHLEALCTAVDRQAHAQIAVVTIHTIDGDQSIEEFATALEEKWKVGPKGTDRGVLMILEMNPRHGRIEVGYGLEGILNDAKVGDIGRSMVPDAAAGNYNAAVTSGVQQIANIIAADAGVILQTTPRRQPRPEQEGSSNSFGLGPLIFIGVIIAIFFFSSRGRGGRGGRGGGGGLGWFLLGNLLGGGGFGGGRGGYGGGGGFGGGGGGGDGGGGFGGFGGGSSGGGGASGDFLQLSPQTP